MMKKIICLLLLIIMHFHTVTAENYAFLISAGEATADADSCNPEFWYDLYLSYEYLLLWEQYDSTNVYVFYGDGTDFNTTEDRYKKELHNWGQITDYNNSYSTMYSVFSSLDNVITDNDNVFIYWVAGHAMKTIANDDDSYIAEITHNNHYEVVNKTQLMNLINSITHYNKRKIFWMTCYSGAIGEGAINPLNNKTVLLTSSSSNAESEGFNDIDRLMHSGFNYAVYTLSTGMFPHGLPYNVSSVCPYLAHNTDSLLSINELFYCMFTFTYLATWINYPCELLPSLFDVGNISNKLYVGEQKHLKNVTIDSNSSYWVDRMEVTNVIFDNNLDINMQINKHLIINKSTFVPRGTTLQVKQTN